MALPIEILSLREIRPRLQAGYDGHVLSIRYSFWLASAKVHPIERLIDKCQGMLRLYFENDVADRSGRLKPERYHVETALEWSRDKPRLWVHCFEGKHRSAAIAYAIACTRVPAVEAITVLDPTRHHPNRRIIELATEILQRTEILDQYLGYMDAVRERNRKQVFG